MEQFRPKGKGELGMSVLVMFANAWGPDAAGADSDAQTVKRKAQGKQGTAGAG